MKFSKYFSYIAGLPKTIYLNFKYFQLKDAIKLPIFVSHHVWLKEVKGKIKINAPIHTGMIKIGYGDIGIFDKRKSRTIFQVSGNITFNGRADLGHGSKISVSGDLFVGKNFCISAETAIVCAKRIVIGDDCLFSWDNLIMDTDFHKINNLNGQVTNKDREIIIGNNVWLGCRCTILKGSYIGNGVVVASNSCVYGRIGGEKQIIGGLPLRVLKHNICWKP